jgi:hypothetical protein
VNKGKNPWISALLHLIKKGMVGEQMGKETTSLKKKFITRGLSSAHSQQKKHLTAYDLYIVLIIHYCV